MNNILENYEKTHLESLMNEKTYPSFHPGDTVKVHLKVKEGEKERIQVFEGVCIAKKNAELIHLSPLEKFLMVGNRKSSSSFFTSNQQNRTRKEWSCQKI